MGAEWEKKLKMTVTRKEISSIRAFPFDKSFLRYWILIFDSAYKADNEFCAIGYIQTADYKQFKIFDYIEVKKGYPRARVLFYEFLF